jgi:hypothetical protein
MDIMAAKTAFKKLLTTASAISLIAGLGSSAHATDRTLVGDAIITRDSGASGSAINIDGITAWTPYDHVIFPGALVLTTGSAGNVNIGNAYLGDGVANGWITVAGHQTNINNIYGSKTSTGFIDVTLANKSVLVIGDDNLSKLGTINGNASGYGTAMFESKITEGHVGEIGTSNPIHTLSFAAESVLKNAVSSSNINVEGNTTFLNNVNTDRLIFVNGSTISTGDKSLNVKSQIYFREGSVLTVNKGGLTGGAQVAADANCGTVTFNAKVNKGDVGEIGTYGEKPLSLLVISDTADDSVFDSTMVVNEIRVQGNSTFNGDVTTPTLQVATGKALTTGAGVLTMSGDTTLYEGATLTVGAGGIAGGGKINGDAESHGILKFDGLVAEDGVGAIGGDVKLSEVEINGEGASTFNEAVRADLLTIGEASDGTALNDLAEAIYLTINGNDTTFNNVIATQLTLADSKGATTSGSLQISSAILSNNSVLSIAGEGGTNGGAINGAADDGDGTVTFSKIVTADQVGKIGSSKTLGTVNIEGKNSVFSKSIAANAVNVKADTTFSEHLTVNEHLILADNKTATTGGFGKLFTLNGDATLGDGSILTIGAGGIAGGGNIDGPSDGGGTIIFNSAVAEGGVGDIGSNYYLVEVDINEPSTFSGEIHANKLNVGADAETTFKNRVASSVLNLSSDITLGSNFEFSIKETITGGKAIIAASDDVGVISFNSTVNADDVGTIGASGARVDTFGVYSLEGTFTKAIYAKNTIIGKVTKATLNGFLASDSLTVEDDAEITTNAAIEIGKINIGKATFVATADVQGDILFTGDGSFRTTDTGSMGGASISTNTAGTGTIEFSSAIEEGNVGVIGEGGNLKEVIVKNNATFNRALSVDTLTLGEDSYTVVQSNLNVETVNFQSDVTLKLDSDSDSTIGAFITSEPHQGTVEFYELKTGQIGQIGTSKNPLSTIKINNSGDYAFTGEIYSDIFSVDSADTVIHSNSSVNIGTQLLFHGDSTFIFDSTDSANIADIDASRNNIGTVIFNSQILARSGEQGVGTIGQVCRVKAIYVNYQGENTFSEQVKVVNLTLGKGANLTSNNNLIVTGALDIDSGNCTVSSQLTLTGDANFTAGGSLIIGTSGSVVGGGNITADQAGKGSVVLNQLVNEGDIGEIGKTNAIKSLTINAVGDSTFGEAISAQTITLGATGANLVAKAGINAGAAVNFASDATLTISGDSYLPVVTTETSGTGSIIFKSETKGLSGAAGVGNIGTSAKPLNEVTFRARSIDSSSSILNGDIYANNINLDNFGFAVEVDIRKSVTANIVLKDTNGDNGHRVLLHNGILKGNISSAKASSGGVKLYGNSTINGDIGREGTGVNDVIIKAGANVAINGNIYTKRFQNYGALTLTSDVITSSQYFENYGTATLASDLIIFSDVVAGNNSTINLAGHNLTATSLGFLNSTDNMNLNFGTKNIGVFNLTNPVMADDQLSAKSTIAADLSGAVLPSAGTRVDLVTLNAEDDAQAELMYSYLQEQIMLKVPHNTLVDLSPVMVRQDGRKLTAYVTTSAPSYEDLIKTQYGQINNEFVGGVWGRFLRAYANGSLGVIEKQYFANAAKLTAEENAALFVKISMVPTISEIALSDINSHASVIFNHNSMIAAGDENSKRGAWTNIFGAHKTQKRNKSNSGFKANNAGITIGSDIAMSEHHTIGLAGSFANNNIKLKDSLSGSKIKAKSYILSLYNIYDINNWVMQGSLSIANTKSTTITADVAKFNSIFYGVRGTVGYQKHSGKNTITPMIGLEYGHYGKSKATEANTQRIIKINALDKFSAILGASIARKVGNFIPEIHAFANYDLTNKAQKTNVRLGSDATMNLATPNAKPARLTYNFGTSIGAKSDRFEYSIGYDASLTENYVSHQGSIKLRVNF